MTSNCTTTQSTVVERSIGVVAALVVVAATKQRNASD
jgi:hypothetical protein